MAKKSFKNGIDEILGSSELNTKKNEIDAKSKAEARTTIVTKQEKMNKLKSIAFWDRKTLKEVIEDALTTYIINYENKNGEVKNIQS